MIMVGAGACTTSAEEGTVKNVCFLFGINGVGKSSLARAMAAAIPGLGIVSASEMLRAALGGVSREQLERLDPSEKEIAKRTATLHAFHSHRAAPLIVCDMHLIVPIRSMSSLRHERMWHPAYDAHAATLCYVTAPFDRIKERRRRDLDSGERIRSLCPVEIIQDEDINKSAFRELFGHHDNAFEIVNDGPIHEIAQAILLRQPQIMPIG